MRNPVSLRGSFGALKSLTNLQNELDRWVNEQPSLTTAEGWDFTPSCDLQESDTEFTVKADLPGIKKEDVKIEVDGHRLILSGERHDESEEKSSKRHQKETFYGSFMRSFTLPQSIDETKVKAQYKDGVLRVSIPKSTPSHKKPIQIQ